MSLPKSKKELKSQVALIKAAESVSAEEASRFQSGQLELVDETLTLKTHLKAGEEVTILSSSVNKDVRKGINDFQDGKLARIDNGGTVVVDKVRVSHAAGVAADDAAAKSYTTNSMPADIENGVIRIEQGGKLVAELKASRFLLRGDESQKVGDDFLELDTPFVLVAGSSTVIKFLRPEGVVGNECFIGIEAEGKKTMPKRN